MPFPHHRLRNALLFLADLLRYHCLNEEDEEEDSGEEEEGEEEEGEEQEEEEEGEGEGEEEKEEAEDNAPRPTEVPCDAQSFCTQHCALTYRLGCAVGWLPAAHEPELQVRVPLREV